MPPFDAVIVNGYVPAVPAAGVPESVAELYPLSMNVTPDGRVAPPSDNVHGRNPFGPSGRATSQNRCKRCWVGRQ